MKRILAMVLCWTMLLSQLVMVAEAVEAAEQSDLLYLEENGIVVEDGGQVIMEDAPLGKSDDAERYSPSVPKFIPETLKNLWLLSNENEQEVTDERESEEYDDSKFDAPQYKATINKDKVMLYNYPGLDRESVYLKNALGREVVVEETISAMWYYLPVVLEEEIKEYVYIYAEDLTFTRGNPTKGSLDTHNDITVHVPDAPTGSYLDLVPIDPEKAPNRNMRSRNQDATHTLLASYDISIYNADSSEWQPEEGEVEVLITLSEFPELSGKGTVYVEHVDSQGNVQSLMATNYFLSNVISISTSSFSEFYIYSVDYPMEADVVKISFSSPFFFSDIFDEEKFGGEYEDVVEVGFSDPECVEIERVYNEDIKVNDWRITVVKPFYTNEGFCVKFAAKVATRWIEVWVDAASDFPTTLVNGRRYTIQADMTVGNDAYIDLPSGGESVVRINPGKTLTVNGGFRIGSGEVLWFTINSNESSDADGHIERKTSWNSPLCYVDGGTLKVEGASSDTGKSDKLVRLDGLSQYADRALVYLASSGRVYLEYCRLENGYNGNNGADNNGYGGGLYMSSGTVTVDTNVAIMNNKGGGRGAGVYMTGGTLDATAASSNYLDICDNKHYSSDKLVNGGGIYVGGTATIKGYINIHGNTGKEGGGIYVNSGTLTVNASDNIRVYSNVSDNSGHGGGIYVNSGTISVSGNEFHVGIKDQDTGEDLPNKAPWGAGIYVKNGTITGSGKIWCRYNVATNNGGGLMVENGTLTVSGSVIMNIGYNTATNGYGGGINVHGSSASVLTETTSGNINVYGNTAKTYGGGVYLNGTINTNGDFIVGAPDENGVEKGNKALRGGGMYIHSGTFAYSGYVNVRCNDASGINKGGGIYVHTGTITCQTTDQLNIFDNKAEYGGGIYIGGMGADGTDTSMKSVTFNGTGNGLDVYNNTASINGGGIMGEVCSLTVSIPLYIVQNTAPSTTAGQGKGGGIFFAPWGVGVTATFASGSALNVYGNTAARFGGGIALEGGDYGASLTIAEGVTVDVNNTDYSSRGEKSNSASNGGGIYISGAATTFTSNGTVTCNSNTASTNGGGMYINNGATVTINGSGNQIQSNQATKQGGGIWAYGSYVALSNCSVMYNFAINGHAGGIIHYYDKDHTEAYHLTLTDCNVDQNYCTNGDSDTSDTDRGAGIYAERIHLTISGGTVSQNQTPYGRGGGIFFRAANHELRISDCTISGNLAKNSTQGRGGGVCIDAASSATITNSTITNNQAEDRGGGIFTQAALTISGGSVSGNTAAKSGGGVNVHSSDLTMEGTSSIYSNTASTDGGGIYLNSGSIIVSGTPTIYDNTAGGNGGGIYSCVELSLTAGLTVGHASDADLGNTATGDGGGIYGVENVTLTGVAVLHNWAGQDGGGIRVADGKTLTLAGAANVNGNTAVRHGGGAYLNGGTITTAGTTSMSFAGNTAGSEGGGLYLNGTTATLTNAQFTGNKAGKNGGGICAKELTLSLDSTNSLSGNYASSDADGNAATATGDGGGIYFAGSGKTLTLTGVKLQENKALYGRGGAVSLDSGSLSLVGAVEIYNNTASTYGGGILLNGAPMTCTVSSSSTPKIYKNTAAYGGGVAVSGSTAQSWSNVIIGDTSNTANGNTATTYGGGVYVETAALTVASTVYIYGNAVTSGNGGGIYATGNTLTINSNTVIANNTATHGGGVFSQNAAVTMASGSKLNGNTASSNGGGAYVNGTGSLTLNGATVSSNKATSYGGGIYLSAGTLTTASNTSYITGNTATNGGGIALTGGAFTANATVILHSNTATNGGGIYTSVALTLNANTKVGYLDGTTGRGNTASSGGGVYIDSGTTTLNGATIQYNTANSTHGGGVFVKSGATMTTTTASSYIQYNTAKTSGGGVYNNQGTLIFNYRCYIRSNSAGASGGGLYNTGTVTASKGFSVQQNSATYGGGVFNAGTVTATDSVYIGSWTDEKGYGNEATQDGGGLYNNGGEFTVNAVLRIADNVAGTNGGGIYIANGTVNVSGTSSAIGTFVYNGKTVAGNNATYGGGIYMAAGTLNLSNGATVNANTANDDGGGIRMVGGSAVLNGAFVANNTAVGDGGGICASTSGSLEIKGNSEISGNSASYGAGIHTNRPTTITDSTITGNTATTNGGGIFVHGNTTTLNGTVIQNNTASSCGGGVRMNNGELVLQSNSSIKENTAQYGGGVSMSGGTLTVSDGATVNANTASTDGGGIHMTGGTANLTGATVDGNYATYGGGIYINNGTANLMGATAITNHVLSAADATTKPTNGAGIWAGKTATVNLTDTATVTGNSASSYGGGIYMKETANVTVDGTASVASNSADSGGGIYMVNGTLNFAGTTPTVLGNSASSHGGGIRAFSGTIAVSSTNEARIGLNTEGNGNTAAYGAGIFIGADAGTVNLQGSGTLAVRGNVASSNGGGIQVENATLNIGNDSQNVKVLVGYNKATNGYGGGLVVNSYDGGTAILNDTSTNSFNIYGNTANTNGGGVWVSGTLNTNGMNIGDVSKTEYINTAQYGGGLFIKSGGVYHVTGGTVNIQNNTATNSGGGVYINDGTFKVDSGAVATIRKNTATTYYGGGVYTNGATFGIDGTLNVGADGYANTAQYGGGMFLQTGAVSISGSGTLNVAYNQATYDGTGATNGGGIQVENAKVTVSGSVNVEVDHNTTKNGYGAGIVVNTSTTDGTKASLTETTTGTFAVHDNTATTYGGGIFVDGIFESDGGLSVYSNKAVNGGGIYGDNGHSGGAVIKLTDSSIYSNEVTTDGGGIYMKAGSATITGGNISGNRAYGNGGGISIIGTATLTVVPNGKSPIRDNKAEVAGNDIYATGKTTALIIPATEDNGVAEYWFADYAAGDSAYPGQPVFPSDYMVDGKYAHLGRYVKGVTPVTFARRSFGGTSTETGASEASTAYLALTLGTAEDLFMDLTLSKTLSEANGAVENTPFIFYIKGVDDADYLLPVMIHLDKGATNGEIVLKNLPVGIYDIFEDESWSWRYTPSSAVSSADSTATLITPEQGDHYARVQVTLSDGSHKVTFGNGLERKLWLTDAEYLPFLVPATATTSTEDEEETE